MALDPKKWTTKTQEAMAAAIDQAKANANPELTPDHVLAALTTQQDTIVPAVLGDTAGCLGAGLLAWDLLAEHVEGTDNTEVTA